MPVQSPLSVVLCPSLSQGQKEKRKKFWTWQWGGKKNKEIFFNPLEGKIHYVELYHIKENMIKIAWYEYSSVTWQKGGSTGSDGSTLLTEISFRDQVLKECVMRFAGLNYGSLFFLFACFLFFFFFFNFGILDAHRPTEMHFFLITTMPGGLSHSCPVLWGDLIGETRSHIIVPSAQSLCSHKENDA